MNFIEMIRRHIFLYRIALVGSILSITYIVEYAYAVVSWVLFLVAIGKIYEIFFLREDKRWDADPVSLNLMIVSKFAEYVWNGFR
ncbi:hypothetical protein M728_004064 (plasmid) [Ensifer sp. WSM1721]